MEPIPNTSPRPIRPKRIGRMVGAGYLIMTASGFDLFYVLAKLYVPGDAAATAANISAHEELFSAGFAGISHQQLDFGHAGAGTLDDRAVRRRRRRGLRAAAEEAGGSPGGLASHVTRKGKGGSGGAALLR